MADGSGDKGKKLFPIFQKNFRHAEKPKDPLQEIQMTLEKSQQPTKKRKSLLGKKETPGLTQMVLDAGQKMFGHVYCDECGMLYSPGEIQDEKEHQKAHNRIDNLFSLRLWKDPNIVQNFPAEGCMIVVVDCSKDSKRILNTLRDLLAWLDSELGGSHDQCGSRPTERIFLYVFRTKRKNVVRVLGCAIVETIENNEVVTGRLASETNPSSDSVEGETICVGLTRLWTDPSFRRKNIASRLCDAIRITWSIPGYVIPKNKLGILEPSGDGKAFMAKYTNSEGLWYTYK